jgi:hypothetical protein
MTAVGRLRLRRALYYITLCTLHVGGKVEGIIHNGRLGVLR